MYKLSTRESINSTATTIKENKNNNYKEYRLRLIKKYFKFLDDTYSINSKVKLTCYANNTNDDLITLLEII